MKIKRLKKSKKARIEIIPMIDIMFFLLATFMLTTIFVQNHFSAVNVDLSKGKADKLEDQKKVVITIDAKNNIFINDKKIDIANFTNEAKNILALEEYKNSTTAIIASDKNSLQGVVMNVMLKAKEAGFSHFLFMVKN